MASVSVRQMEGLAWEVDAEFALPDGDFATRARDVVIQCLGSLNVCSVQFCDLLVDRAVCMQGTLHSATAVSTNKCVNKTGPLSLSHSIGGVNALAGLR